MNRRQRDKLKSKELEILKHAERCEDCLQGYVCQKGGERLDAYERTRARYRKAAREKAEKKRKRSS